MPFSCKFSVRSVLQFSAACAGGIFPTRAPLPGWHFWFVLRGRFNTTVPRYARFASYLPSPSGQCLVGSAIPRLPHHTTYILTAPSHHHLRPKHLCLPVLSHWFFAFPSGLFCRDAPPHTTYTTFAWFVLCKRGSPRHSEVLPVPHRSSLSVHIHLSTVAAADGVANSTCLHRFCPAGVLPHACTSIWRDGYFGAVPSANTFKHGRSPVRNATAATTSAELALNTRAP